VKATGGFAKARLLILGLVRVFPDGEGVMGMQLQMLACDLDSRCSHR